MDLIELADVLEETKQVLKNCFKKYKLEEVFLSFNGGKDCTVLLDITLLVLQEMYERDDIANDLKVVYIRTKGPFKEIEEFVQEIKKIYGVKLIVSEGDMKKTLQKLLVEDPKLKACLMGTRRTDPHSENLRFMQKTDPSWPQIVRVSPLLNWSYHQIWKYIFVHKVSYCSLYDVGYTSIGSTEDTSPNPALLYKDARDRCVYAAAWRLVDPALERAGRGPQPCGELCQSVYLDDIDMTNDIEVTN
ncbi:FAD synthase-like [Epargyreus clarus]|uniref:FAD synthase-like n=1 Tax=Epargyreus clarus TaxID=520877 RepID=UPI003C2AFFE8